MNPQAEELIQLDAEKYGVPPGFLVVGEAHLRHLGNMIRELESKLQSANSKIERQAGALELSKEIIQTRIRGYDY